MRATARWTWFFLKRSAMVLIVLSAFATLLWCIRHYWATGQVRSLYSAIISAVGMLAALACLMRASAFRATLEAALGRWADPPSPC